MLVSIFLASINIMVHERPLTHVMGRVPQVERRGDTMDGQSVTVRGQRTKIGNAVNCPEIQASDGSRYNVSYLPPDIELGDLVEVSGPKVFMATCVGEVIKADKIVRISRKK